MEPIRIGVIKEGKVPPDFRTPLTPAQCKVLKTMYPQAEVVVQSSPIRTFSDQEYRDQGIEIVDNVLDCDIILGVKEVPIPALIPNKTFLFFSHTIKKQPYNRDLLNALLDQKIRLIDYEVIKDKHRSRLIGFGRYAGIVGCYNGFLTYGLKHGAFTLKPAHKCHDRKEVEEELKKVVLPNDFKCLVTGFGRVGHGAKEIIDLLPIKEVSPEEYLTQAFNEPVFCQLEAADYYRNQAGGFDKAAFYANPSDYTSILTQYAASSDMYIPCHYWDNKAPVLLTQQDFIQHARLKVVADISCDIAGPIACTIRPSKIGNSIYGWNPSTNEECDFSLPEAVAVMAVDNLPCELPKDASEDFGSELLKHVFPRLLGEDPDQIIYRASETTLDGTLNEPFLYLSDYVAGKE
jgi:saccharopine dehydrogenase (NAD+, L-lysine-forming)